MDEIPDRAFELWREYQTELSKQPRETFAKGASLEDPGH